MRPKGIDNFFIQVGNLDEACRFYEALGFVRRFKLAEKGLAILAIGEERPGLILQQTANLPEDGKAQSAPIIWIEVADADAYRSAMVNRNLGFWGEPFETATGRTVELVDPWGNRLGFADYQKRPDLARPS